MHNKVRSIWRLSGNRVRKVCKGKKDKIVRDTKATYMGDINESLMERWANYFKGKG